MTSKPHARSVIMLAGIAALAALTGNAVAEQFDPPSLEGFMLHAERDADGDGDGKNETHIKQYLNTSGDSLASMSIKGVTWAWTLNTRDSNLGSKNYVIRDSNCDGIFDEVYGLDEEFHVPDCMKQKAPAKAE